MKIKEQIDRDLKEAMKEKQELRLSVLRMLSSAIHNREIEKRAKTGKPEELTDEEVVAALRSEIKKRKDAAESFEKGGRVELARKERDESKIIESYLPAELSDDELKKIVAEAVQNLGEVSPKDFGRVMGEVMKKAKGRVSGERVSQAVKNALK